VIINRAITNGVYTLHLNTSVVMPSSALVPISISQSVNITGNMTDTTYSAAHYPVTNSSSNSVTITFDSPVTSFTIADIILDAGTTNAILDSSSFSGGPQLYQVVVISASADGTYLVKIRDNLVDNLGRMVASGDGVEVQTDFTAPIIINTNIEVLNHNRTIVMPGDVIVVTFNASEPIAFPNLALYGSFFKVGGRQREIYPIPTHTGREMYHPGYTDSFMCVITITPEDAIGEFRLQISEYQDTAGNIGVTISTGSGIFVSAQSIAPVSLSFEDTNAAEDIVSGKLTLTVATNASNTQAWFVLFILDSATKVALLSSWSGPSSALVAPLAIFPANGDQEFSFAVESVQLPSSVSSEFIVVTDFQSQDGTHVISMNSLTAPASNISLLIVDRFAPLITTQPSSVLFSTQGEAVTFNCTASGSPAPSMFWTHNSKQMGSFNNQTSITISHPTNADEGLYRCHAVNDFGSDTSNAFALIVNGIPEITAVFATFTDADPSYLLGGSVMIALPSKTLEVSRFFVYWSADGISKLPNSPILGYSDIPNDNLSAKTLTVDIPSVQQPQNATFMVVIAANQAGEMEQGIPVRISDTHFAENPTNCPGDNGIYNAQCAAANGQCSDNVNAMPVSNLHAGHKYTSMSQQLCNVSDTSDEGKVGGEGFAFVVHSDARGSEALGCSGKGAGFASQPNCLDSPINRSIAVELDSFFGVRRHKLQRDFHSLNSSTLIEYEHEAIISAYYDGSNDHDFDKLTLVHSKAMPRNYRINDGSIHSARIVWKPTEPPLGIMTISLDDVYSLASFEVDISRVIDADGKAWIGFTGSTGLGSERFEIVSWRTCVNPSCADANLADLRGAHVNITKSRV
jgi:hypothetical protein